LGVQKRAYPPVGGGAVLKNVENHVYAQAFFYMHYNFCRIHQTLRVTPAMQAGITDHGWTIEEMLTAVLRF
jgi:hypothetical protein